MGEIDVGECIEILTEIIHEKGEVVFREYWDSGGPGAGADVECIYKYREHFWRYDSDYGLSGPFYDFEDSLWDEYIAVTSATRSIDCSEWSTEELIQKIKPKDLEDSINITINGEKWQLDPNGNLICRELKLIK
jgi:hypothetical protein